MTKEKNKPYFIGVDIGTGSTKAIAMDSKGTIIADSQLYYSTENSKPGYSNKTPKLFWKLLKNVFMK